MTPIPDTFSKHGYVFRLIKRAAKAAIYAQTRGERVYAYEVHRIRVRKAGMFRGKPVPATERLPVDAEWGLHGKTYTASLYGQLGARMRAAAQYAIWAGVGAQAA